MASVYKGYDPALDREVAIKVISTAGQPADFVSRFQREARLAARLRHANIVQIYHFGGQQDIVYMVQELLPGPTLEQRMHEAGRRARFRARPGRDPPLSSIAYRPSYLRYSCPARSSRPALTSSSASVSTSIGPVSASQ